MKKILVMLIGMAFLISCNNNSTTEDQTKTDSFNMNTDQNSSTEVDRVPHNQKDTSSYERMSGLKSDSVPQK